MTAPVRASLMVTCLGDLFFPEVGVSMVRLLRRLGVAVDFPGGQTCCGLPLFNSGYHTDAARVAARTVEIFKASEHVVVSSGSCAWMVKHAYPGLLRAPARREAAARLAGRTHELSQFLVKVLGATEFQSAVGGRVTYHDSCHLLRGLHESESPRTILRRLTGAEWHRDDPETAAGISFITGPSRTADIELTLTRGVHGPKEVHAIFVERNIRG